MKNFSKTSLRKLTILLNILCLTSLTYGQKFMIVNGDTLPLRDEMEVLETGDTIYHGACRTFEKIKGQIVNQSDEQCLRQGPWIITDSAGNYWSGNFKYNNKEGIWKLFNKTGKLLKETEHVSFGNDQYLVKEIDYVSGTPVTLLDKIFLAFYIKHLVAIMVILFVTFFGKTPF